jgi:hypothetical protein
MAKNLSFPFGVAQCGGLKPLQKGFRPSKTVGARMGVLNQQTGKFA